jgi:hypothetical protein
MLHIILDIFQPPAGVPCPCPGDMLVEHVHPEKSATKYFYKPADGFNEDPEVAKLTIDAMAEFDADERVFSILTHDASLLPIVDFFPESANRWKELGWGTKGHWRFVTDFAGRLPRAM